MQKKITVKDYIIIFLMSVSLAVGLNNVLLLLDLPKYSQAYQDALKVLYAPELLEQIFITCVLVPIAEEFLFRRLIFKVLRKWLSFTLAMMISAILFGFYHGNLVQFVYATLCGLALAYLYEHFQNIVAPIVAHMVMNLVAVLFSEYGIFTWMFEGMYRTVEITLLCIAEFGFAMYCLQKNK